MMTKESQSNLKLNYQVLVIISASTKPKLLRNKHCNLKQLTSKLLQHYFKIIIMLKG